jgi:predicted TIM-barrel enzyme
VLIGSGLTPANAGELLAACDGAIVGTSIMRKRSVDPDAAAGLAAAAGAS